MSNMFYIVDDFNVRFSEDRTTLIKAPESLSGTYEIPNSVKCIEDNAFYNCANLEKIIFPSSITKLGDSVFAHCKNLKAVILNSELKEIGNYSFAGCISLKDLSIPSSVQSLGFKTFCECKSLKTINIPDNCICDSRTFEACESLSQINIPESWEEIPDAIFYECKSLEHIILPSTLRRIGDGAFAGCSALLTFDTGNGVEEIGDYTFAMCNNLRKIRFGHNLHIVGKNCFANCANLRIVYWDAAMCDNFNTEHKPFCWYVSEYEKTNIKSIHHFYFGNSVKHIPAYLCEGLDNIEEIEIPENVETIGEHAFGRCNPRIISINKNIKMLWDIFGAYGDIEDDKFSDNMFLYCTRLEEIIVSINNPNYASKDGSLYNKDFSELIKIGKNNIYKQGDERFLSVSVKQIGKFAGIGLDITHLSISGCENIGTFAFYDCHDLKRISFNGNDVQTSLISKSTSSNEQSNELQIHSFAFGDCPSLSEIYWDVEDGHFIISEAYQIWGYLYGEHCTDRQIRSYNFSSQIKTFLLGKNISKLPTFLSSLTNVTELILPLNIMDVNGGLPPNLSKLTILSSEEPCNDKRNFVYKNGFVLSKDGSSLYRYMGNVDEIISPDKVTLIITNQSSHVQTKMVIIPNSVTEIGKSAFKNSNIESFVAPENLEIINEDAFKNCSSLVSVQLNPSLRIIHDGAFQNCNRIEHIVIPDSTEYKYDILKGCSSLREFKITMEYLDLTGLTSLSSIIWDVKGDDNSWEFDMFAKERHYDSRHTYYDEENSIAHHIESLIITDNVENIPQDFAKCMSITEVEIPKSVKHIGEKAFYYCKTLEKIILHSMDIEIDEDFCHFYQTHIKLYQVDVDCTPTKIIFEDKDVTDIFNKRNKEIIVARRSAEAERADFEQYVNDSFYAAYEGEWDPNGEGWEEW